MQFTLQNVLQIMISNSDGLTGSLMTDDLIDKLYPEERISLKDKRDTAIAKRDEIYEKEHGMTPDEYHEDLHQAYAGEVKTFIPPERPLGPADPSNDLPF